MPDHTSRAARAPPAPPRARRARPAPPASPPRERGPPERRAPACTPWTPSVQLRRPLLLQFRQRGVDLPKRLLRLLELPLVVRPHRPRVQPRAPLRVLHRPLPPLPLPREVPELRERGPVHVQVPEEGGRLPRRRWRRPRQRGVEPPEGRVRAPPPARDEERDREDAEGRPQVRARDQSDALRRARRGQEKAGEDEEDDAHHDPERDAVQRVVLPVDLAPPREQEVHERPPGEEEDEGEREEDEGHPARTNRRARYKRSRVCAPV